MDGLCIPVGSLLADLVPDAPWLRFSSWGSSLRIKDNSSGCLMPEKFCFPEIIDVSHGDNK